MNPRILPCLILASLLLTFSCDEEGNGGSSAGDYTCANGTAVTGTTTKDNKENCSSCENGYHIEGEEGSQTCVVNAYACTNGTAVTTGSPTEHNAQNCSECDDGYHTDGEEGSQTCAANVYTCENGDPVAEGTPGGTHNTQNCATDECDDGYHIEGEEGSQTCAANEYSCPHGGTPTTVTGDMRPSGHLTIVSCSACDTTNGYRLKHISGDSGPQTCVANAYSCPFGTAVTTGRPVTHETVNCSACKSGYELSEANEDNPRTCIRPCGAGAGTEDDPRIICDYTQLKAMSLNLDWHYKLRGNENGTIDATASRSEGTDGCTPYDPDEENIGEAGHPAHASTCTGWTPVGTSATNNAFTGSLEGAGYAINNLYINIRTGTTRVGLFGQTSSASVIQNVGMTNAYIEFDTINSNVGGLVGRSAGSISNSYATGSVKGGFGSTVGGLVGNNTGTINNSYARGEVAGTRTSNVGGLVGWNSGSINNSYARGKVAGAFLSKTGGLVGVNRGDLSNSYATTTAPTDSVSAGPTSTVGGLVGVHSGRLSNSYATAPVAAGHGSNAGGLGGNNTGTISGKNYFVDIPASDGNMNGIGGATAFCGASPMDSRNVCIHATGADGPARRTWLQDTLDESAADTADPPGLGWSETNWEGFVDAGVGYPKLLYAQVASYCSDGSDKNESACEASGSCSIGAGTHTSAMACTRARGNWTPNVWWLAGGDECGGSTGVVCGARIPGQ